MTLTTNYQTLTYNEGDYRIDVVYNRYTNAFESWLYHKDYGDKKHMFSIKIDRTTLEEFIRTIENGLKRYIKYYEQEIK